jgi:hypothetical protein
MVCPDARLLDVTLHPFADGRAACTGFVLGEDRAAASARQRQLETLLGGLMGALGISAAVFRLGAYWLGRSPRGARARRRRAPQQSQS